MWADVYGVFGADSHLHSIFYNIELLAILIKPLVGVTLVSSGEGYPCGVAADQLSLGSAIPPIQMPVPPLQPSGSVIFADDESNLHLGLGTGIMQAPGPCTGVLDLPAAISEQAQLEQQIQQQQIEFQRQQLQGVHPDLVLPGGTMAVLRDGLQPRRATARTVITGVTELAPSSQQQILTQPFASANTSSVGSPVVIMDQTLLDNRHAQRFKQAIEIANEVSSVESSSMPASITTTPALSSTSLRKKISERIRDSPLIREVGSSWGHHRRRADDDNPDSPYQIEPQRTMLVPESQETRIEPAKEVVDMAVSPPHGLGLVLGEAPVNDSEDIRPHPVEPPYIPL